MLCRYRYAACSSKFLFCQEHMLTIFQNCAIMFLIKFYYVHKIIRYSVGLKYNSFLTVRLVALSGPQSVLWAKFMKTT